MQADKQMKDAFIQVIREHERLIYKVCSLYTTNTEDKNDLYQDIILQAWKAYPQFKGQAKVSTWLYRIALNTAISINRKKRVKHHYEESILMNFPDPMTGNDEQYKLLYKAISELPELERALVLLYLEDKSHAEIAEIMGLTISNVGTKLSRIKDKMKKIIQPLTV
jgi:RNA polymerase sigma-70 factor (ECF subfamily)